jgi:ferredoxin
MAYVVAEPCVKCKYTDCVAECPVDCFYEGVNILVINPDECIDCGACVPVCPTQAIFAEEDLPNKWSGYAAINAKYAPSWPNLAAQQAPMPEAEEYKAVEEKRDLLVLEPAVQGAVSSG